MMETEKFHRSILISGLTRDINLETVLNAFSDYNVTGGGVIQSYELYRPDKLRITYFYHKDAERVLSRGSTYKIGKIYLHVSRFDFEFYSSDSSNSSLVTAIINTSRANTPLEIIKPIDQKRILLTNVPNSIDKDYLDLYLEYLSDEVEIERIDVGEEIKNSIVVTYSKFIDFENLKKKHKQRPKILKNNTIVLPVYLPNTVVLEVDKSKKLIEKYLDSEILELYFNNKKRSGGQNVKSVKFDTNKNTAYVSFENFETAKQVCNRVHLINNIEIRAKLYYENIGPDPFLVESKISLSKKNKKLEKTKNEIENMTQETQQSKSPFENFQINLPVQKPEQTKLVNLLQSNVEYPEKSLMSSSDSRQTSYTIESTLNLNEPKNPLEKPKVNLPSLDDPILSFEEYAILNNLSLAPNMAYASNNSKNSKPVSVDASNKVIKNSKQEDLIIDATTWSQIERNLVSDTKTNGIKKIELEKNIRKKIDDSEKSKSITRSPVEMKEATQTESSNTKSKSPVKKDNFLVNPKRIESERLLNNETDILKLRIKENQKGKRNGSRYQHQIKMNFPPRPKIVENSNLKKKEKSQVKDIKTDSSNTTRSISPRKSKGDSDKMVDLGINENTNFKLKNDAPLMSGSFGPNQFSQKKTINIDKNKTESLKKTDLENNKEKIKNRPNLASHPPKPVLSTYVNKPNLTIKNVNETKISIKEVIDDTKALLIQKDSRAGDLKSLSPNNIETNNIKKINQTDLNNFIIGGSRSTRPITPIDSKPLSPKKAIPDMDSNLNEKFDAIKKMLDDSKLVNRTELESMLYGISTTLNKTDNKIEKNGDVEKKTTKLEQLRHSVIPENLQDYKPKIRTIGIPPIPKLVNRVSLNTSANEPLKTDLEPKVVLKQRPFSTIEPSFYNRDSSEPREILNKNHIISQYGNQTTADSINRLNSRYIQFLKSNSYLDGIKQFYPKINISLNENQKRLYFFGAKRQVGEAKEMILKDLESIKTIVVKLNRKELALVLDKIKVRKQLTDYFKSVLDEKLDNASLNKMYFTYDIGKKLNSKDLQTEEYSLYISTNFEKFLPNFHEFINKNVMVDLKIEINSRNLIHSIKNEDKKWQDFYSSKYEPYIYYKLEIHNIKNKITDKIDQKCYLKLTGFKDKINEFQNDLTLIYNLKKFF